MKHIKVILLLYWCYFNVKCQLLNKEEGADCNKVLNEVWTCQRLTSCIQVGDFKRTRPQICGFIDKEPIVCCPPNDGVAALVSSEQPTTKEEDIRPPDSPSYDINSSSTTFDFNKFQKSTNDDDSMPPFPNKAPYALTKCIENEVKLCSNDRNNFMARLPIQNLMEFRTENRQQTLPLLRRVRNVVKAAFNIDDPVKFTPVVVGGKPAMRYQFPFVAAIGYGEEDNEIWDCGGTIISETWVLTAAHCAQTMSGPARWIGLAGTKVENQFFNGMVAPVSRLIVHPDYKEPAMYHDIALLQMPYKVQFNNAIKPVCLHPLLVIPRNVTVAGWGTTEYGGQKSSDLLFVDLRTVDPTICQRLYDGSRLLPRGFDSDTMLCAGETKTDACTGDSGGPLFFKSSICLHVQLGIVSFGRNCGIYPGVYTRISYYLPWIEDIVWPVSKREAFNPFTQATGQLV